MPGTRQVVRQVIGPPGTGKTTRAMEVMDSLLKNGHQPEEVALVSFTRAAVREAQERIERQFGVDLSPRNGGKVSTIHSLCYWGLGISAKGGVFARKDWRQFCKDLEIATTEPSGYADDDAFEPWEPTGNAEGDVFLSWYDWARNSCLSLEEAAQRYNPGYGVDFMPSRMLRIAGLYETAKAAIGKPDFCDLLRLAVERGLSLHVKALLVDEAQDLSVLQRRVVEMWMAQTERTWFFYDPDQAIFSFQGADPRWLMEMDAEREFLSQSWRVPRAVAVLANAYIARNRSRFDHQFLPRDAEGKVMRNLEVSDVVAAINNNGLDSWGLLARNRYLLSRYTSALLEAGIPYRNLRGRSPTSYTPAGVLAALRLAAGEMVRLKELAALARLTPAAGLWIRGAKADLERVAKDDPDRGVALRHLADLGATNALQKALCRTDTALGALSKLTRELRSFYQRVVERRGLEGLLREPNVIVGTIHSVKGMQRDHVVMLPDWVGRTAEGDEEDPEAERRVWYVGQTRAYKTLTILEPVGRLWNGEIGG